MNDIICPHCKKTFKVDEAGFADILKQVRNSEFEKEIYERLCIAEKDIRFNIFITPSQRRLISKIEEKANHSNLEKYFDFCL